MRARTNTHTHTHPLSFQRFIHSPVTMRDMFVVGCVWNIVNSWMLPGPIKIVKGDMIADRKASKRRIKARSSCNTMLCGGGKEGEGEGRGERREK